jgi:GWxTD domain-containing protein
MKRLVLFITLVLLGTSPPAASEDFKGETDLVRRLEPEERVTYFGLQYLINKYQKRQFLSLPTPGERAEWVDRYWIDEDPTPATEANERRIEHEKRVALARKLFGMRKAPGWDRRGEVLIRFGLPSEREKTAGTVDFHSMTPPGEVWYYRSLDMIIHFQDYNLKGEYIFAIEPTGRSSRRELERQQNVSTLMKYGLLEMLYPTEYMSVEEVKDLADFNPDEIDYQADPEIRIRTAKDLIAQHEAEQLERKMNNFDKYMEERPVIYSFEINQKLLPLYFDITAFKGGQRTLRTEVNFEVPSKEVQFVRREGALTTDVELRVLVRDLDDREIASGAGRIEARVEGDVAAAPSLLPGQIVLALEPGYYRVGVEAYDANSKRRAALRTNLELEPYAGALALSDIQFASSVKETEDNTRFLKGNLQVTPHPIRAYAIPFPVIFYFEIYGLDTDVEGIAYYTVDYRIIPLAKRRKGLILEEVPSVVTSSFETSGYGSTQAQRLSIATEHLWEGPFRLSVTVTDRRTFKSVTKSEDFSILK